MFGFIGLAMLGLGLVRLLTGNDDPRPPQRLPASPEGRVDVVVRSLNEAFGKDWVRVRLGALKSELAAVLPSSMVALVDFIHMIEDHATDRALSGKTKRWWALSQAARAGAL